MKGQALITLLFFTVIATTVTSAAVMIILVNSLNGEKFQQGSIAYEIAQSGIENAKLRLLRDTGYTGEVLPVGNGTATVTVSKVGNQYTVLSVGKIDNFMREIQLVATYSASLFTISSQQEVY